MTETKIVPYNELFQILLAEMLKKSTIIERLIPTTPVGDPDPQTEHTFSYDGTIGRGDLHPYAVLLEGLVAKLNREEITSRYIFIIGNKAYELDREVEAPIDFELLLSVTLMHMRLVPRTGIYLKYVCGRISNLMFSWFNL